VKAYTPAHQQIGDLAALRQFVNGELHRIAQVLAQDEAPVGETLPTTGATGLLIAVNRAGTVTLSRVSYGAADSAGVGYRALRVEN